MSAAAILQVAQTGVSLLGAMMNYEGAKDSFGSAAFNNTFQAEMERFQIKRSANLDVNIRYEDYASSMGAQKAALAGAGVVGGRTMQLLEAKNRLVTLKAVGETRIAESLGLRSSEYREAQTKSALTASAERYATQTVLDLAGTAVRTGFSMNKISEAQKAKTG